MKQKEGKAWVSVLVRENKVVAKQVTVGLNNKVMAEIASGLDEGMWLLLVRAMV